MATYTFEVPDEVINLIRSEFKIEPTTYLQKLVVDTLMVKYADSLREKDAKEVETRIEKQVAEAKKQVKVKNNTEK